LAESGIRALRISAATKRATNRNHAGAAEDEAPEQAGPVLPNHQHREHQRP
jgi:hypothetical protein